MHLNSVRQLTAPPRDQSIWGPTRHALLLVQHFPDLHDGTTQHGPARVSSRMSHLYILNVESTNL